MTRALDRTVLRRRELLLGAVALAGCAPEAVHDEAAQALRRTVAIDDHEASAVFQELVRNATLAPSSHNTQCWRFERQAGAIRITPDLARRCPVVDPDDHHLFVSLGCATENLAQAALAHGWRAEARFDDAGEGAIAVGLAPTRRLASPLFHAIAARQCTRGDYDGVPLAPADLRLLEQAGTGPGVQMLMLTDRPAMERVLAHVVAGNTAQLNDPAFVAELKQWIRFNPGEAQREGDGLYTGCSGNATVPRWLGRAVLGFVLTPAAENDRYARQVRNSAGIAVFVTDRSDRAHWVEAGRCFERFALQATALGIRHAFLNQAVEVAPTRQRFAASLGLGLRRPDLVVRFGRGPALPYSLRRPLRAVMV